MSFINEKTIDTRFNYLKHLSLKSLEFKGSLKHIKGPDDQGQLVLSGCQKIIRHIKDFFLYIPMNIVASIIEGSLFPKIDYHKSNHLNFSYFINSGEWMPMPKPPAHSEPCCGSPSSPMGRQIRGTYYPYRYIDSNYLIKSEEGTTALKYSGLGPDYAINKVPHDIKEKKLVIFFQGNGETLAQFDALKKTFMQTTNTAVCMVDWAKHGASEGTLDHESMLRQAELVYQFAIQHLNYKEEDITIKGMSLGCYQALSLAERHPNISELELDQPFTTMEQISRTDAYCNSGFFILRWVGALMKRAIRSYYNFNNMSNLSLLKDFKGSIKVIRRTNDTLTSLDENNLPGSCLTNDVIKKIVEEKHSHEFHNSTIEERAQWMNEYLSTEHLREVADDPSIGGDKKQIITLLKQLVKDTRTNISDT